jgi:hypothetical protein
MYRHENALQRGSKIDLFSDRIYSIRRRGLTKSQKKRA